MWLEETISPSTSSSGCTTVVKRSSAASRRGSPWALWPKRKFSPIATLRGPERAHEHVVDELVGGLRREGRVERDHDQLLTPSASISSALRASGVSSFGVCWGATTETGWGSNVSTLSAPAITSRWPRCTPSKVPTATLRPPSFALDVGQARDLHADSKPRAARPRGACERLRRARSAADRATARRAAAERRPRRTSNGPIAVRRSSRQ